MEQNNKTTRTLLFALQGVGAVFVGFFSLLHRGRNNSSRKSDTDFNQLFLIQNLLLAFVEQVNFVYKRQISVVANKS